MFSSSKDKIDDVYAYLREYFNIEDAGELNKYPGVDLECCPYGSIRISQHYLTQRIVNMISGMYN